MPYVAIHILQDDVAGCFEYYADLAEGLDAKQKAPVSLPMETFRSYVLKEPLGVVGLITPWYMLLFFLDCLCIFPQSGLLHGPFTDTIDYNLCFFFVIFSISSGDA